MLSFAEKYNWWSPKDSKETLSLEQKIENLLEFGTLDELKKGIAETGRKAFVNVWDTCKNNPYAFKKRRRVLEVLLSKHV